MVRFIFSEEIIIIVHGLSSFNRPKRLRFFAERKTEKHDKTLISSRFLKGVLRIRTGGVPGWLSC